MSWWQAIILGIVQGLTEFLPVSSSGHLVIFGDLLGVDPEGFLDFTVTVHTATVLSTLVVFWATVVRLLKGLFRFRYNDETDYVCKILVSMIPVGIVGVFFKDQVEALFGDGLVPVGVGLCVTAFLLFASDRFNLSGRFARRGADDSRNGISWWQALAVGLGQAFAVAPGLSRSGTTIATGLLTGVKRENIAQFSFLMVLLPILGEQALDLLKTLTGHAETAAGAGAPALVLGFVAAFLSGLLACRAMVALVKKTKLIWFAVYCLLVAVLIFIFA